MWASIQFFIILRKIFVLNFIKVKNRLILIIVTPYLLSFRKTSSKGKTGQSFFYGFVCFFFWNKAPHSLYLVPRNSPCSNLFKSLTNLTEIGFSAYRGLVSNHSIKHILFANWLSGDLLY